MQLTCRAYLDQKNSVHDNIGAKYRAVTVPLLHLDNPGNVIIQRPYSQPYSLICLHHVCMACTPPKFLKRSVVQLCIKPISAVYCSVLNFLQQFFSILSNKLLSARKLVADLYMNFPCLPQIIPIKAYIWALAKTMRQLIIWFATTSVSTDASNPITVRVFQVRLWSKVNTLRTPLIKLMFHTGAFVGVYCDIS